MKSSKGDKVNNQLKKGVSEIIILEFLKTENYGYAISEYMNKFMSMKLTSVYAILSRLEQRGHLQFRTEMQGKKAIKFYLITYEGRQYLDDLYSQWEEINNFITHTKEHNESTK